MNPLPYPDDNPIPLGNHHSNFIYATVLDVLLDQMSRKGRIVQAIEVSLKNWQQLAYQIPTHTFLPPEHRDERVALVIAVHGRKLRIFASAVLADTHLRVIE